MAKRKNVDKRAPAIVTWAGADVALADIRSLQSAIDRCQAEKDAALQRVAEEHDMTLGPMLQTRDALARSLEEFATLHRADFGVQAQSKRLNSGVVGFRKGQRSLKTLSKWTWEKVMAALQANMLAKWIRIKYEPDREAILRDNPSEEELKII